MCGGVCETGERINTHLNTFNFSPCTANERRWISAHAELVSAASSTWHKRTNDDVIQRIALSAHNIPSVDKHHTRRHVSLKHIWHRRDTLWRNHIATSTTWDGTEQRCPRTGHAHKCRHVRFDPHAGEASGIDKDRVPRGSQQSHRSLVDNGNRCRVTRVHATSVMIRRFRCCVSWHACYTPQSHAPQDVLCEHLNRDSDLVSCVRMSGAPFV